MFKVGDKVKRIIAFGSGFNKDDVYTVASVNSEGHIRIEGKGPLHRPKERFKLYNPIQRIPKWL